MSVSIVALVTLLSTKATTFRQVVFLSIATQAASHFLLGIGTMSMSMPMNMAMPAGSKMDMSMPMSMPTNMNSWTMLAAHSIGAILSMIYLWHCEKFWSFAGFLLFSFRPLAGGAKSATKRDESKVTIRVRAIWPEWRASFIIQSTVNTSSTARVQG